MEANNIHLTLMDTELEGYTLVNRIQSFFIPLIVSYVNKKKEKHVAVYGSSVLKSNFLFFDGFSSHVQMIRDTAGKAQSLIEIYNFYKDLKWYQLFFPSTWVAAFWEGLLNCKAVRNRYRLTKSNLASMLEFSGNGSTILELAAGTAQAMLETMATLKARGIIVYATLVDTDQRSLEEARYLARFLGVEDQIETVVQDLIRYLRVNHNKKHFDVVEMVGIADYLDERQLAFVYHRSNEILKSGGKLITANITNNFEREFTHTVVNWPNMFYREMSHMDQVLRSAGFPMPHVFKEPTGVYVIGVSEKA